jgi:hypothetical protein
MVVAGREVEYSVCDPTLRAPRMQVCRQTQRAVAALAQPWLYVRRHCEGSLASGLRASWRVPNTGLMR